MIDLEGPVVLLMEKMGRHEAIACLSAMALDRIAHCEHAQRARYARHATIANQAHGDVRLS